MKWARRTGEENGRREQQQQQQDRRNPQFFFIGTENRGPDEAGKVKKTHGRIQKGTPKGARGVKNGRYTRREGARSGDEAPLGELEAKEQGGPRQSIADDDVVFLGAWH